MNLKHSEIRMPGSTMHMARTINQDKVNALHQSCCPVRYCLEVGDNMCWHDTCIVVQDIAAGNTKTCLEVKCLEANCRLFLPLVFDIGVNVKYSGLIILRPGKIDGILFLQLHSKVALSRLLEIFHTAGAAVADETEDKLQQDGCHARLVFQRNMT